MRHFEHNRHFGPPHFEQRAKEAVHALFQPSSELRPRPDPTCMAQSLPPLFSPSTINSYQSILFPPCLSTVPASSKYFSSSSSPWTDSTLFDVTDRQYADFRSLAASLFFCNFLLTAAASVSIPNLYDTSQDALVAHRHAPCASNLEPVTICAPCPFYGHKPHTPLLQDSMQAFADHASANASSEQQPKLLDTVDDIEKRERCAS